LAEQATAIVIKVDAKLRHNRLFRMFQGSVVTVFKWGEIHFNYEVTNILRNKNTKNYENWLVFVRVIWKKTQVMFFGSQCIMHNCKTALTYWIC